MGTPQLENGYTRIANEILENLPKLKLNGTQRSILDVVFRYTYGYGKKEAEISLSCFAKSIGCSASMVSRELKKMIDSGILIELRKPDGSTKRLLSFNKECCAGEVLSNQITVNQLDNSYLNSQGGVIRLDNSGVIQSDNTIKKYINKTIKKGASNDAQEANDLFEQVWKLYPNKKGKAQVRDKKKKELMKIGYEKLSLCIERYKKDKPEWQEYQNGSTFFNSGYVDYLDENYSQSETGSTESDYEKWERRRRLVN